MCKLIVQSQRHLLFHLSAIPWTAFFSVFPRNFYYFSHTALFLPYYSHKLTAISSKNPVFHFTNHRLRGNSFLQKITTPWEQTRLPSFPLQAIICQTLSSRTIRLSTISFLWSRFFFVNFCKSVYFSMLTVVSADTYSAYSFLLKIITPRIHETGQY